MKFEKMRIPTLIGALLRSLPGLSMVAAAFIYPGQAKPDVDWAVVRDTDSAESYARFILGAENDAEIEEAFCRLETLDPSLAARTASRFTALRHDEGVNFDSCAMTGAAQLYVI